MQQTHGYHQDMLTVWNKLTTNGACTDNDYSNVFMAI